MRWWQALAWPLKLMTGRFFWALTMNLKSIGLGSELMPRLKNPLAQPR